MNGAPKRPCPDPSARAEELLDAAAHKPPKLEVMGSTPIFSLAWAGKGTGRTRGFGRHDYRTLEEPAIVVREGSDVAERLSLPLGKRLPRVEDHFPLLEPGPSKRSQRLRSTRDSKRLERRIWSCNDTHPFQLPFLRIKGNGDCKDVVLIECNHTAPPASNEQQPEIPAAAAPSEDDDEPHNSDEPSSSALSQVQRETSALYTVEWRDIRLRDAICDDDVVLVRSWYLQLGLDGFRKIKMFECVISLLTVMLASRDSLGRYGFPPIFECIRHGRRECFYFLLGVQNEDDTRNYRPLIDVVSDKTRATPLHQAAYHGRFDMVSDLLKNGADPFSPTIGKWLPIHNVCKAYGLVRCPR